MGQYEFSLESFDVEVHDGFGDDHGIEIRGEHLRGRAFSWIFANECSRAWCNRFDNSLVMLFGKGDVNHIADHRTHFLALHEGGCMLAAQLRAIFELNEGEASVELDDGAPHAAA